MGILWLDSRDSIKNGDTSLLRYFYIGLLIMKKWSTRVLLYNIVIMLIWSWWFTFFQVANHINNLPTTPFLSPTCRAIIRSM